MNMNRSFFKKFFTRISFAIIRIVKIFSEKKYVQQYRMKLKRMGMDIALDDYYIDPSTYFDNYDYSLIHIGERVTISREVLFLTHDYSVRIGLSLLEERKKRGLMLKEIWIEDNCFIGARASILPGTHIGKNSIVGTGAVVKGNYPENSIIIGNPARVIANTLEWGEKHRLKHDFIELE